MMAAHLVPDPMPIMRLLIDSGADVNLQMYDGFTALMLAVTPFQNWEPAEAISFA
jgi:ankyrin repeat protein